MRLEPPLIGSFFASTRRRSADRHAGGNTASAERRPEGRRRPQLRYARGLRLKAILRAALADLRAGELSQGGSTLTQQLVKSYFLDNRRTLLRKIKELAMAVILDARYQKADLLNAYINEIYLGQDGERAIHGFGLGSQFYFNKPLSELDPAEIALLIAVIRGPSYYNPFTHPERARARRDLVLGQMREFGLINAAEHAKAHPRTARADAHRAARRRLLPGIPRSGADATGPRLRRQRTRIARLPDLHDAASRAYRTPRNGRWRTTLDRIEADRKLPRGELEAAMLCPNTQTGEISAVVGGRKAGFQGFNRALNARRPVGSLVKPVVYLTALESGQYNLATDRRRRATASQSKRRRDGWDAAQFRQRGARTGTARARARRFAEPRDRAPRANRWGRQRRRAHRRTRRHRNTAAVSVIAARRDRPVAARDDAHVRRVRERRFRDPRQRRCSRSRTKPAPR